MNENPTPPPPITLTIGGKAYTGTHPTPAVWREFQEHASPDAHPMAQVMATATLLAEIIGTEAKNEVASRVAAGEIRAQDIIDAVHDAASQWREQAQSSRVEPLTADERDVLRVHVASASGRVWTGDVLEALNPWPWESVEDVSELVSERWDARNSRLVAALFGLERRGYLTPPWFLNESGPMEYRDITDAGRAILSVDRRP